MTIYKRDLFGIESKVMGQHCEECSKLKATLVCGHCHIHICKACANFVDAEQFSFLPNIPESLSHQVYCGNCFASHVAPEIETYQSMLDQAREILVYEHTQGKETRFIRRIEKPVYVHDCADYEETILRLAFQAVISKHNSIIDVEVKAKKIATGKYQTTSWSGKAIPAHVEPNKLMKDRAIWQNPN